MRCVACGGAPRPDGSTADGALARCTRCGTRTIEVHEGDPVAYGAAYRDGADPGKAARLVELFAAHGGTGGALLDVGCGDGEFLARARDRGWSVHGVDADARAVAAVRARGIAATCGRVPEADVAGAFAAITLWDLIEHVRDPAGTAAWLARRCAPGGRVVVLTPDARSAFDRIAALERAATRGRSSRVEQLCLNRYHLQRFTADGLDRLFRTAGFATVALDRVQLFSLRPARYLAGFAPGVPGFSRRPRLDAWMSRAAFAAVRALRIANKLLYVGVRR